MVYLIGSCYVIGNKEILPCQGYQVGECTEPGKCIDKLLHDYLYTWDVLCHDEGYVSIIIAKPTCKPLHACAWAQLIFVPMQHACIIILKPMV